MKLSTEYFKHLLIRTPLQEPAQKLQSFLDPKRKNPELQEIYLESGRVDLLMKRALSPSSNCIDIGCHLGSMLSKILKLAPEGNHLVFEPTPHKAQWLKQKFPEIMVLEMALGDTSGEATFYQNATRSGFSGLRSPKKADDSVLEYTVRVEQLDKIVDLQMPIDFIKVDVEGGELSVLRGATQIIGLHSPLLLFECTKLGLSNFEFEPIEVFEFLTQRQYQIFLLKDLLDRGSSLDYQQFERAMQYPFQAFNFVAVPSSSELL